VEPISSIRSERWRDRSTTPYGREQKRHKDRYWLHLLLFAVTLVTTVYEGGNLTGRLAIYAEYGASQFVLDGLRFGATLLFFLTVHEFGHYFAARHHGVSTSLPYFIPLPFVGVGTLGAVIRIREAVPSLRKLFDIGAAGPLAGFVVALAILLYAFATLPPPTYIFGTGPGHEAIQHYVEQFGSYPTEMLEAGEGTFTLVVGDTLLYWILKQFFSGVPPMWEMYHYPVLFAGWLALFFTALNLLPVGQLDGGHVIYALFGRKWHARLARGFFVVLLLSGAIGFVIDAGPLLYEIHPLAGEGSWFILAAMLYFYLTKLFAGDLKLIVPTLAALILLVVAAVGPAAWLQGFAWSGWLLWCLLLIFLVKVDHPPVLREKPLTRGRIVLGVLSILVFILCFSFKPLYVL
jgi:membrane-associated protease RseP (regulator of RpoE activity)